MIIELTDYLMHRDTAHWFLETVQSHRAQMTSAALDANLTLTGAVKGANTITFRGAYSGTDRWTLAVQHPENKGAGHQVFVNHEGFTTYDLKSRQYSVRQLKQPLPLRDVMTLAQPSLDDFFYTLIDPDTQKKFFESLKKVGPWEIRRGAATELIYRKKTDAIVVSIDPATNEWVGLRLVGSGNESIWTMKWSAPASDLAFHPPTNSFQVAKIDPLLTDPIILDASLRPMIGKMIALFEHPSSLAFQIQGNGEKLSIWVKNGSLRQKDEKADWVAGGKTLALYQPKTNAIYIGKASNNDVIEAVANVGTRVDPLARGFLKGTNPLRELLSGMTLKKSGKATIHGASCTLIAARLGTAGLDLIIRDSDSFPVSVATTYVEAKGATTAVGVRELTRIAVPAGGELRPDAPANTRREALHGIIPERTKPI